ncbi:MAG: DUF5680 domain-containing protein [Candidatus Aenigmatarchaeota archaeon]
MSDLIAELNQFIGKAGKSTYAGSGPESKPQRPGFRELEYKEGPWIYRDSYTGFIRSWGEEVVWRDGKPFWTQIYGGGMEPDYEDPKLADQTFDFLKKALSVGEKEKKFQPRGPKKFSDDEYDYVCEWQGDIRNFKGSEKILYKGKLIFTHVFFGGIVVA